MRLSNAENMRAADRHAIEIEGIPSEKLMEVAAAQLAKAAWELAGENRRIAAFCGADESESGAARMYAYAFCESERTDRQQAYRIGSRYGAYRTSFLRKQRTYGHIVRGFLQDRTDGGVSGRIQPHAEAQDAYKRFELLQIRARRQDRLYERGGQYSRHLRSERRCEADRRCHEVQSDTLSGYKGTF